MISAADFNRVLVEALPELGSDCAVYEKRRSEDPEFLQSFFSYSFIPTLQVALDQHVEDFCHRAFSVVERLLVEGDAEVQAILADEFFDYGPACEKWMRRAHEFIGPIARGKAMGR